MQLKALTIINYAKLGKTENKDHMVLKSECLWLIKFTLSDIEDRHTFCLVHIYLLGPKLVNC